MKRFSKKFKTQAESIRLSAAERRDVKERLMAYMEYHPLPARVNNEELIPQADIHTSALSSSLAYFKMTYVRVLASAAAVFAVVLVPLAAQNTLPGDVLYPVKVSFNEELRGSLTFSPYEKVEWETERLERRIAEARLLANEGRLTDEVNAEVAEAVKEHSAAAQKEIAAIRSTDTDEAAIAGITFSSALEVQSEMLESDIEKEGGASGTISMIAKVIANERAAVAEDQKYERPSYAKLVARLEDETTRAVEYLAALEGVMTSENEEIVKQRLGDIARKMADADALQRKGGEEAEDSARILLTQALTDTRKLISYLTNIDVKENLNIDRLVPASLSDEERLRVVYNRLEDMTVAFAESEALIDLVEDETVLNSTQSRLDEVSSFMKEAETAVEENEIAVAETASLKAFSALVDLQTELITYIEMQTETNSTTDEQSTSTEAVAEPVATTTLPTSTDQTG